MIIRESKLCINDVISSLRTVNSSCTVLCPLLALRTCLNITLRLASITALFIRQRKKLIRVSFQSYNEYGDIIKATVAKARELNKVNCARTMVASLISLFRELHDENGGLIISRNSNQFASLKVSQ